MTDLRLLTLQARPMADDRRRAYDALTAKYGRAGNNRKLLNRAIAEELFGGLSLLQACEIANTAGKWDDYNHERLRQSIKTAALGPLSGAFGPVLHAAETALDALRESGDPRESQELHQQVRQLLGEARDLAAEWVLDQQGR